MDYTLYAWHVLTHRVPLLYRFHRVHHSDLEMDATTALRFHFGEFVLSIPFRAAQIGVLGVSPRALAAWQRATGAAVLFHHSNLRLPIALERWLSHLVVTPRMHGIHHSIVFEEQDSNWSSGLSIWDTLHGTRRANVPQAAIEIGLPDKRDPRELTTGPLLAMPFGKLPRGWALPDGRSPGDARGEGPRRRLQE
jgi:sterol desaturase/sphingolipid hydroxylase (fatty acid hydroxylase superfamily)